MVISVSTKSKRPFGKEENVEEKETEQKWWVPVSRLKSNFRIKWAYHVNKAEVHPPLQGDLIVLHWPLSRHWCFNIPLSFTDTPLPVHLVWSRHPHSAEPLQWDWAVVERCGGWSLRGGLVFCWVNIDAEAWCGSRAVWKEGMTEESTGDFTRRCYDSVMLHYVTIQQC